MLKLAPQDLRELRGGIRALRRALDAEGLAEVEATEGFEQMEKEASAEAVTETAEDAQKTVFEIGKYTVKEGPTGGWLVLVGGQLISQGAEVVSRHENKAEALAAAKRYQEKGVKDTAKEPEHTAVIKYDGDFDLAGLLLYINKIGAVGHSFSIVVDPDDKENEKKFGFDGDGSDRIHSVEIDGKQIKQAPTAQDVKGDPNSNEAAFSLAIKRDRLQYLRRVKSIKLIPDKDQWNGQYDQTTGEVTLEAKFSEQPFVEKLKILLHEGGHHGQQIDPETYQAYLDAGLNRLVSFIRMANCVHIKDWQKNGIEHVDMTEEVFAESYARFCLELDMPEELRKFWEVRAAK